MSVKRKVSQSFDPPGSSKRSKSGTSPTIYPCDLCTSRSNEGITEFDIVNQARVIHCHLSCVEIVPEMGIPVQKDLAQMKMAVVLKDPLNYHQRCDDLECSVCHESHGAKIQCTAGRCVKAFHINCAQSQAGVKFEKNPKGSHIPYRLLCEGHNKTAQLALKKSQERALRTAALAHASAGTPVVIRFSNTGRSEMYIVSVDMAKEQVQVTSDGPPFDRASEEAIYTVDFKAIVINEQFRSLIPPTRKEDSMNSLPPTKSPSSLLITHCTAPLIPTTSYASQSPSEPLFLSSPLEPPPTEPIYISSSSSISSDTEVLNLLDPIERETTPALDLVPGLMDRVVQFLTDDPEWNQIISGVAKN